MTPSADIALVGLGVMGSALARNFHGRGLEVAVYDRGEDARARFARDHATPGTRYVICEDLPALAAALERPRRLLVMVPAGPPVDAVLQALAPHLDADDIVIDGGNSHFPDTVRRAAFAREAGFRFVGMGVSGGEEGALNGPAMMPGGDVEAWERLRPVLELACAQSDSGPCVDHCGRGGAGHFVKMVHNGIEYGDMQLIAETHQLLRHGLGQTPGQAAATFARWNEGPLQSYLIEITAEIADAADPAGPGALVDAILDVAGQKGTGRWTSATAIELGVPLPTITAAVDARALSAARPWRLAASAAFPPAGPVADLTVADLEHALYAAKIMSYTQGFALLAAGSAAYDFGTDLARVARIWKAGCIIRARFLDRVHAAFSADPGLPLLLLDPGFQAEIAERAPAWRRVVAACTLAGWPVPALSASLAFFDTLTRARGSADLIQAQRDYFGAHTYRRTEAPDVAVHTEWAGLPRVGE
ncbi:MAG: NADP-dependent phosphogluconate dehydrogenase [bacterium]